VTDASLESVCEDYIERVRRTYVPGTYRTWRSYTTDLHRYLKHTQDIDRIGDLGTPELDDYMVWVADKHPGSTASSKLTFLNNFSKFLKRQEHAETVLTEDFEAGDYGIDKDDSMRTSEVEGAVKPFLQPEKVKLLWENAPSRRRFRNETLIKFMWLTGLRRHEISLTRLDEVERVPGEGCYQMRVYSRKTAKKKNDGRKKVTMDVGNGPEEFVTWLIYFDDSIATQLQTWKDVYRPQYNGATESPYLFLTNKSERMSGNYINEMVKKAARNAGIQRVIGTDAIGREHKHVVAHTIRHSYGTHIANSSGDVSLTQLMYHMGHSDYTTTQLYVHDNNKVRMQSFSRGSTTL
jgi:site-specific recombinase XerD